MTKIEEFKLRSIAYLNQHCNEQNKNLIVDTKLVNDVDCFVAHTRGNKERIAYADINSAFQKVEETLDFEQVMKDVVFSLERDVLKDNIVMCLLNTDTNGNVISNVPHRQFLDMTIVYAIQYQGKNVQSVEIISNDRTDYFNLPEELLFELAKENTKRIYNVAIKTNEEFLEELRSSAKNKNDKELEMLENAMRDRKEFAEPLLKVKSDYHVGASTILLDDDKLYQAAVKFNSDLCVLVMTAATCCIIPISSCNRNMLEISTWFEKSIQIQKRTGFTGGDHIYYYNLQNRQLSIVLKDGETPEKYMK